MSGEGLIADRRFTLDLPPRRARQAFAVLAKPDTGAWTVRILLTGDGTDCACAPVQLDLSPDRADLLAQELMQMAALARKPGSVPE